jgi:hypothetical protein
VPDFKRLGELADKIGTAPAQVGSRQHIQRGRLVFPKSVTPPRMRESFERFDFELEPVDIGRLSALDQGPSGRIGPNPDASAYLPRNGRSLLPLDGIRTKLSHAMMPSSNTVDFPRRPTLISEAKSLVLILGPCVGLSCVLFRQ